MWNLPNSLTVFRIGLVPVLVAVLLTEFPGREFWGLGIFLVASITDLLDGITEYRSRFDGQLGKVGIDQKQHCIWEPTRCASPRYN